MTIRIEPLLIRLSFTFLTFSPWNLAVWGGSCRWRLWVTSRYPRLSSGCRREDPGPALHRNDDLNDQDQEIYKWKLTLKPSSGGLEQLVTNLSSALFWSSPSPVTTWTNQRSVFWSPLASWPIRERYFSSPARTLRWSGGSARSRQRSWCGPEH